MRMQVILDSLFARRVQPLYGAGRKESSGTGLLFTRQMYLAIESRSAWDHTLHFSSAPWQELRFWYSNIDSFKGYSLRPPPDSSTVIFSDASDVGFGGFSASLDGVTASGMFTAEDLGQSSTFRELNAIYYVLLSCAERLSGEESRFSRTIRELRG